MEGERFTNRLIHEKSPYLRQHAHNPVNWYPWGREAFDKASELDLPIFLSIGYATCHWCHVMERESFSHVEVARILNENFINIKVDREELPEVDSFYIEAAAVLSQTGVGWPLNLILTPDLKPIFATTYLPPENRPPQVGLKELAAEITLLWKSPERGELIGQADKVIELMQTLHHQIADTLPAEASYTIVLDKILENADPLFGGAKGAPKFPMVQQVQLALQAYKLQGEGRALFYAEKSLEMMARGGIRDHLGGGFSRYAMDDQWLFPHFEKMLYDNALIAEGYLNLWLVTGNERYKKIASEGCDYVLRTLAAPEGGFYSGEDAETEGKEGKFYTWSIHEVNALLGPEDAALFLSYYNMSAEGNFQPGLNVLFEAMPPSEFAESFKLDLAKLEESLEKSRQKLFEARDKRVKPSCDHKILTGWNGMMIHTLARMGLALERPDYLESAKKSARFILQNLYVDGRLLRRYCEGEAKFNGNLEDHAFFIRALITLFEAEGEWHWLEKAVELTESVIQRFRNPEGGYFESIAEDKLFIRRSEFYDDTLPSSNAIQADNLMRLYQILADIRYLDELHALLKMCSSQLAEYPVGLAALMMAMARMRDPKSTLAVLAMAPSKENEREIKRELFCRYHPHLCVALRGDELTKRVPTLEDKETIENKTTLYLCTQLKCYPALTDLKEIEAELQKL